MHAAYEVRVVHCTTALAAQRNRPRRTREPRGDGDEAPESGVMATASLSISADTGQGIREYVALALDVLDELGIRYELTPMATNMEGDVETIARALAEIHRRCHERGAVRVGSLLKIDDRVDVDQTLRSKVEHVDAFRAQHKD